MNNPVPALRDNNEVAAAADRSRTIGDILVDSGRLDAEKVALIVAQQEKDGSQFGEAALALNLVTKDDVMFALARQYDYAMLLPGASPVSKELVVAYSPHSNVGERIRALRDQLALRWFGNDPLRKVLAVVSAEEREGKSFMTANLAAAFAQQGLKTLLIDSNMRNPRQQQIFGLERGPGLSSVLSERVTLSTAIETVPTIPGLSLLIAGSLPPNPSELLGKPAFAKVLLFAASNFDVVLVDTPSGNACSDATIVASRAGGALVVARKDKSMLTGTSKFAKGMRDMGVALVGSVLNDA